MKAVEELFSKASGAVKELGNAAEGGFALLGHIIEETVIPAPKAREEQVIPQELRNVPTAKSLDADVGSAELPDLFDSLIIAPAATPKLDMDLSEGDKVHVWSKTKGTWIEDGKILEISQYDVQILGDTVTKGSVYVLFDEGNKSKWVRPCDIHAFLRKPGTPGTPLDPSSPSSGYNSPKRGHAADPDDRLGELHALRSSHRGQQFIDDSFPPQHVGRVTKWCRPHEIGAHDGRILWRREDWQLLRGQPRADDVQQGELGDCWFLSSLAAMAEFQGGRLVQRLLPEQNFDEAGVYLVRLWLGGCWRDIIVDDRLPCIGNGRSTYYQLAYCSTRRCQLWASVIEKGFAKACGSYQAIAGGEAEEALTVLTGWPCQTILFDEEDFDADILWATMCTSREAKFLMTVSTSSGKSRSEQDIRAAGLVPNHAYSLIDVLDVLDAGGDRVRLLKIRNPHAKDKWRGNWSEGSPLWTPELRAHVASAKATEDGMFFMGYGDFLHWFERCTICKVQSDGWHKVRMPTPLPGGMVPSRGWRLRVSEMTECCLTIAQPQDRTRSGPLFQSLNLGSIAAAGFVLVCVDDSQRKSLTATTVGHPRCRAVVSADCWLKPGLSYFLLPLSLLEGPEVPAVFSCFSRKTVQIQEHSFSDSAVLAAWAAFIRSNSKAPDDFHGAKVYMAKSHGGMVVCMAENRGRGFFQVKLDFQQFEACRLHFSRGSGHTKDWLAPGQAQILQVVIPAGGSGGWRSSQHYEMRFMKQHHALHSPDLAVCKCSELHQSFALEQTRTSQGAKWLPW